MTPDGSRKPDPSAAARAIDDFLVALGRDPAAEPHLIGTGRRVAQAFTGFCAGYLVDVDHLIESQVFEGNTAVIAFRNLKVATICPHHLLPALGSATVAFAPRGRLIGFGAIADVVEAFARRLTLQEVLGEQVTQALNVHLRPAWAACKLELTHGCMTMQGERQHNAPVETISISGEAAERGRAEILSILAKPS